MAQQIVTVGKVAPLLDAKLDAVLANDEIGQICLKDLTDAGKWVVLYFYPLGMFIIILTDHMCVPSTTCVIINLSGAKMSNQQKLQPFFHLSSTHFIPYLSNQPFFHSFHSLPL